MKKRALCTVLVLLVGLPLTLSGCEGGGYQDPTPEPVHTSENKIGDLTLLKDLGLSQLPEEPGIYSFCSGSTLVIFTWGPSGGNSDRVAWGPTGVTTIPSSASCSG
jgi:hypothetical protein